MWRPLTLRLRTIITITDHYSVRIPLSEGWQPVMLCKRQVCGACLTLSLCTVTPQLYYNHDYISLLGISFFSLEGEKFNKNLKRWHKRWVSKEGVTEFTMAWLKRWSTNWHHHHPYSNKTGARVLPFYEPKWWRRGPRTRVTKGSGDVNIGEYRGRTGVAVYYHLSFFFIR